MPIDRTAFNATTDDDGSNTVGTVVDKQFLEDVLLDPIDAAIAADLAAVAPAPGTATHVLTSNGVGVAPTYQAPTGGGGAAVIQTTTATGTQSDFALTTDATLLRCNNATAVTFTGFVAGTDGQRLQVRSVGAGLVHFAHQQTSAAANQLINFATSGVTSLAAGVGVAEFVYDATTARWCLVAHDQGAWITPAYSAGDFTAAGAMTWTVDSGDVFTYAYWLRGRVLLVRWKIATSSIGGTLNSNVFIKVPGGFTGVGSSTSGQMYGQAGVFADLSAAVVDTGAPTQIAIYTAGFGAANFAASTNTSGFYGAITVEVA